jgi:cellulose synthase/poly-beta-1,6-N-acetylglucosamine synthase-like glycosyltransferase
MPGFLDYFFGFLSPLSVIRAAEALPTLLSSLNYWVWLVLIAGFLRMQAPPLVVWLLSVWRPAIFLPDPFVVHGGRAPLVSVVIAARNEAERIEATIRSVLDCGYPNLEVVVVDDGSGDATILRARRFHRSPRVKVLALGAHGGKPAALNRGLEAARGEYVLILDADTELQAGSIPYLLGPLMDPHCGAVTGVVRVRNANENLVTGFQECEYAASVAIPRSWRASMGVLSIIPGGFGLFRAEAVRRLGGFDSGLGDDTDITLRLRKAGWGLAFTTGAVVWATVPRTWSGLCRQRRRWERNMVKIRLRKQGDLLFPWRYGWRNAVVALDTLAVRVFMPWLYFSAALYLLATAPLTTPMLISGFYWLSLFFTLVKTLIAYDITASPQPARFLMLPVVPFLRLGLRIVVFHAQVSELLRIGSRHPYVPDRVWAQTPHW